MLTASEARRIADTRPITMEELGEAIARAARHHGYRRLDSEELGHRALTEAAAEELRGLGYDVHVMGDTRWSIQW